MMLPVVAELAIEVGDAGNTLGEVPLRRAAGMNEFEDGPAHLRSLQGTRT